MRVVTTSDGEVPMDAVAGKAALDAAAQTGGLLTRLLGPTADLLGIRLADWTSYHLDNFHRVIADADTKRSVRGQTAVAPKLGRKLFEEAAYADNAVAAHYVGGLLASARNDESTYTDRGLQYAELAARMSVLQLRTHYLLYSATQQLICGVALNAFNAEQMDNATRTFAPFAGYIDALDLSHAEPVRGDTIFSTVTWLEREELLLNLMAGPGEFLRENDVAAHEGGMVYTLTPLGIELFMWALGRGSDPLAQFALLEPEDYRISDVEFLSGARRVPGQLGRFART